MTAKTERPLKMLFFNISSRLKSDNSTPPAKNGKYNVANLNSPEMCQRVNNMTKAPIEKIIEANFKRLVHSHLLTAK